MPFDSWGSHLENDIQELENYCEALEYAIQIISAYQVNPDLRDKKIELLKKLLRAKQIQKERKEYELKTHRQRDKERGVKY